MPLENKQLLEFLGQVDKELIVPIKLVAVGGTAMTLLKIKTSTIDMDFVLSQNDTKIFENALEQIPHGFKIDLYNEGLIFSQQLPQDYYKKAIPIKTGFKKIKLFTLQPLDIVATKIGRLNERDIEDIADCIKKFGLQKKQMEKRAKQVQYVGYEENYKSNLSFVLKKFFK